MGNTPEKLEAAVWSFSVLIWPRSIRRAFAWQSQTHGALEAGEAPEFLSGADMAPIHRLSFEGTASLEGACTPPPRIAAEPLRIRVPATASLLLVPVNTKDHARAIQRRF